MVRNTNAIHRRHGAICTSVFHASQNTHASAGSHTEPGGYTGAGRDSIHQTVRGRIVELAAHSSEWAPIEGRATNATGQFEIADDRAPSEIADLIRSLGYEPVWKDWDSALSA